MNHKYKAGSILNLTVWEFLYLLWAVGFLIGGIIKGDTTTKGIAETGIAAGMVGLLLISRAIRDRR